MDNRPIGFFDSGIGGVTAIPHIMKILPNENIIFYGDTARTPYGSKSEQTIRQFTMQIADFLVRKDVKMIVIACNTVSSIALKDLREKYPSIPIIGAISPTAHEVVKSSKRSDKIGIMATRATVRSTAYENKIRQIWQRKAINKGSREGNRSDSDISIDAVACPAIVPLIEEGIVDNEIMNLTIKYYLDDFVEQNRINTMVLGCTHYPLILPALKALYPDVNFISSSMELATAVKMELEKNDMLADGLERGVGNTFYASDLSESFVSMIERILGKVKEELNIKFKNLDV